MRCPALSVSSSSRREHFCYELWGLEMLLPDRLCEDLILLSLAHQCLTIKTYIWNFSVFRTWARTGPLVTSVSSEALWGSLALHVNALWCPGERSLTCSHVMTSLPHFPPRPELRLLFLDATLCCLSTLNQTAGAPVGNRPTPWDLFKPRRRASIYTGEDLWLPCCPPEISVWQCSGGQLKRELQHFRAVRDKNVQPSLGH